MPQIESNHRSIRDAGAVAHIEAGVPQGLLNPGVLLDPRDSATRFAASPTQPWFHRTLNRAGPDGWSKAPTYRSVRPPVDRLEIGWPPNALFGVAKKTRHDGPRFARLHRNCCANVALPDVLHRFLDKRHRCGKNRLLSGTGMAKIGQRWRDNHRRTRIRGRR